MTLYFEIYQRCVPVSQDVTLYFEINTKMCHCISIYILLSVSVSESLQPSSTLQQSSAGQLADTSGGHQLLAPAGTNN